MSAVRYRHTPTFPLFYPLIGDLMAKIVRLFCAYCNHRYFYRPDRRTFHAGSLGTVLPFEEQRTRTDRRRVLERRVADALPTGMADRRGAARGRRFRDGYAWFEGCIEEDIQSKWQMDMVGELSDSDAPVVVLCPKCRKKIR